MEKPEGSPDLLPGTLDLLILKTLTRGVQHGYGIAQAIQQTSEGMLEIEEGSLYPALQRLLLQGWVAAEWGRSENNRRARFYRLTTAGRKQLGQELSNFDRLMEGIYRVLRTT
jgi:transcriptional regulator